MAQGVWLAVLGVVVGAILALTGAGGGALAVPLLLFGAGLPLQRAAPMSLVAVGLAAAVGAGLGLRQGIVRYRAAAMIGVAGMATAPLGVALGQRLPQSPLLVAFAAFMALTAWRMLRPAATSRTGEGAVPCLRADGARQLSWTMACAAVLARTGGLSGLLSGLFGVGGGFVIVPALERRSNLDLRSIQATSLAVIALVAVSGLTAAAWRGQVSAPASLPFAAGALGGLLAGRQWSQYLPLQRLRQAFAVVALCVAALVLARALGWSA